MIVRLLVRVVVEKMWSPRTMSSWGFSSFAGKAERSADESEDAT